MNKTTVGFIATPLTSGHATRGVGMYTKFLLDGFDKLTKTPEFNSFDIITLSSAVSPEQKFDLIHYPFFDLFFPTLTTIKGTPTVVTIHDVTPLKFPDHYPPGIKGKINFLRQKLALKKVSVVITDSEISKKEIAQYLNISPNKIEVIPLAPQISIFPKRNSPGMSYLKDKYHLPEKFVLYVGDVNWNKNLIKLTKGAKLAKLPLVIVGKQAVQEELALEQNKELDEFRKFLSLYGKDKEVVRTGFVPQEELAAIYSLADVYCQASRWEGFGLSCLEAASAGCPVVASEIGPLIELLDKGAIYVDPESPESIARGLREALSPQTRRKMILAGKKRASLYSWEKTAKQTFSVYQKVSFGSNKL